MSITVKPISDSALASIAEGSAKYVEHRAAGPVTGEDLYAMNITSWMGERMPYVLARLAAVEADNGRLLSERESLKLGNEVLDASVTELRDSLTSLRPERDRLLAFANWTARNTYPLTEVHTAALTAIDSPSTRAALADLAEVAAEVTAGSDAD